MTERSPLIDLLFEKTLQYIHEMKEDDYIESIMRKITDKKSFVKVFYENSKPTTNAFFWKITKMLTVGAGHSIDLGNTKGQTTIQTLTPIQFGGVTGVSRCSSFMQELGSYGERWIGDQLKLMGVLHEAPGKICKISFPISSTTPDYIFLTGRQDCPKYAPIQFEQGAILGVGEVKTSFLQSSTVPVWKHPDVTLKDLIEKKSSMIKALLKWRRTNRKLTQAKLPIRLRDYADLCTRITAQADNSICWSLWYYDNPENESEQMKHVNFDWRNPDNDASIKLFTTSIGRQMLCEALSVLDYVNKESKELEIRAFFPSVINKKGPMRGNFVAQKTKEDSYDSYNGKDGGLQKIEEDTQNNIKKNEAPYFVTSFSLACTLKVSVADLKELDKITNNHLAEAIYKTASARFLV